MALAGTPGALLGGTAVLATVGLIARAWVHRDDDAIGRRERPGTTAVGAVLLVVVVAGVQGRLPRVPDPLAVGLFGLVLVVYPEFAPSGAG
jgi:hypothetical protein